MNRPSGLTPGEAVAVASRRRSHGTSRAVAEAARPETRQKHGKALVVTGWVIAVVGVVLYCVACFAADSDADLGAIVFGGSIPAARAALVIVAGGTLLWIVGSVMHVNAALDLTDLESPRRDDEGCGDQPKR